MAKPLNENLKAVCIETEEGDLIPVMDLAGAKIKAGTGLQIISGIAGL